MSMARIKKESFPEVMLQFFRSVPWWIGPIAIAVTFVILRWAIPAAIEVPQIHADLSTPEKAIGLSNQIMGNGAAQASRFLAPWLTAVVGAIWFGAMAFKYRGRA